MKYIKAKIILPYIVEILFGCNPVQAQDKINYSNPALIMGTSFGKFLKTLYKIGDYNSMLQFTASQSRNKFKDMVILNQYMRMDFGYSLKLISIQKENQESIMSYSSKIYGTTCIIRFRVLLENDSVKIILPSNFLKQKIFLYR
jgi:hypothetical protein